MKILALTILFILLFFRIKGTPSALSKTLWRNKMLKTLDKNKETFKLYGLEEKKYGWRGYIYIPKGLSFEHLNSKKNILVMRFKVV